MIHLLNHIIKYARVTLVLGLVVSSLCLNAQSKADLPYQNNPQDTLQRVVDEEVDTTVRSDDETSVQIEEFRKPVIDTVTFRTVPDTTAERLKRQKDFEYANDAQYWVKEEEKPNRTGDVFQWLFTSPSVKTVMYLLLGLVLVFAIYKVIMNNNLFYRPGRKIATGEEEEVLGEAVGDLDDKIRKAIGEKEYRKAVRYLYVKTLRDLDQKNLIRYHSQATNYDYMAQVSQYKFAGQFSFLTQVYDYVWYGGFELSPEQFDKVLTDFTDFFNGLKAW